jgi:Fur family ferric uptake transcriptional regulator
MIEEYEVIIVYFLHLQYFALSSIKGDKMRASSVDQVIIQTLSKEHAHLTSLQIYDEIRKQLPAVNQSTIYRSLERLVSLGLVSVSDMGTGATVYETVADGMHHHLVCQKCRKVITISHEDVTDFFSAIQQNFHFSIITNHLILFGICEECQKTSSDHSKVANN